MGLNYHSKDKALFLEYLLKKFNSSKQIFVQSRTKTLLQPRYNPKYKIQPQFRIQKAILSSTSKLKTSKTTCFQELASYYISSFKSNKWVLKIFNWQLIEKLMSQFKKTLYRKIPSTSCWSEYWKSKFYNPLWRKS